MDTLGIRINRMRERPIDVHGKQMVSATVFGKEKSPGRRRQCSNDKAEIVTAAAT
jgi:hypothetical protein